MIAGVDCKPPTDAQLAAMKASGVQLCGLYHGVAGDGIDPAHLASDADFDRVRNAGLATLAYVSGNENPVAIRNWSQATGVLAVVDVERFIRSDGDWVDAWLVTSEAGLYGNGSVHFNNSGLRTAACHIYAGYYGYDPTETWPSWLPRPPTACGWQFQGTTYLYGAAVDLLWLDDAFSLKFGPGGGTIGGGFGTLTDIEIQARFVAVLEAIAGNREATNDLNGALFYPTTDPNYGKFAQLFEDKVRAIVKAELDKLPASSGGAAPTNLTGTITGKLS